MLHASPVAGGTDQAIDAKSKPATKNQPKAAQTTLPGEPAIIGRSIGGDWESLVDVEAPNYSNFSGK